MPITIFPVSALKDNYIWLIVDTQTAKCLIVDPGDAAPVINTLSAQSLTPMGILLTHHHADHTAGAKDLLKKYTVPVFGSALDAVPAITDIVADKEAITIPYMPVAFEVIAIPGHTHGHIAYFMTETSACGKHGEYSLFCGDTLFTGGCGRVFEGTMAQMYTSLQRLAALPETTKIYCGHEYTAANLKFALAVEPENLFLQQRIKDTDILRAQNLPTVPSTLAQEKQTNPFLRCDVLSVKHATEKYCGNVLKTPEEVFSVLRNWKNNS